MRSDRGSSRTARAPRHRSGGAGEAAGPEDAEMMMPPPVSTHAGRLRLGPQPACAGRLLVRLLAVRPVCIVARVERRQDQGGSAGHLLVRSKK